MKGCVAWDYSMSNGFNHKGIDLVCDLFRSVCILDCQSRRLGLRDAGIDRVGVLGMIMNTMALTRVVIL